MEKGGAFLSKLKEIVSSRAIDTHPSSLHRYAVSGALPAAVVAPGNADMLTEVMKAASSHSGKLVIAGSGTKLNTGLQPDGQFVVVSTRKLSRVSDHDVSNFTVTAQTGTVLSSLQDALAKEGQFLPIDPPYKEATLGGTLCSNNNGPLRLLYGGLRDLILGARVIIPGGSRGSFGGKVVKNVAGYDMSRFLIGSMGTLCVVEEVTMKLFPLPEREATCVAISQDLGSALAVAEELRGSQLSPARIVLIDYRTATVSETSDIIPHLQDHYTLLISFHGFRETVERQLRDTSKICSAHGAADIEIKGEDRPLWERMRDVNGRASQSGTVILKMGFPSSKLAESLAALQSNESFAKTGIWVDGGCGIVYLYLFQEESEGPASPFLEETVRDMAAVADGCGGYMSVENAPSPLGRLPHTADANRRTANKLMELIRQKFDPHGTLCPERVPWFVKI